MKTMPALRTLVLLACLLFGVSARTASAQQFGGRLGVSGGPTQFYIGPHAEFGPIVERLSFLPNVEIGVGDDATLFAFNVEFAYRIPLTGNLRDAPWQPYVVAGPSLVFFRAAGDTTALGGFNIGFGLQHSRGLFTEIKLGVADSPDFKFGIGYNFR